MRVFRTLATAVVAALCGVGAEAGELRISIQGVATSSGTLMVGLYDSAEHFQSAVTNATTLGSLNDASRLVGIAMRAVAGTQSVVFTNLEPGSYGIIAFHDENDNGKLDETPWGVPSEGYGFSNNAEGFLDAPSFKDAAVTLDGHDRVITITLKYPGPQHLGEAPDLR